MTLFDMFNKAAGLTEDAKKYNTGDISEKTGLQKQPDGSWKPPKAKGSQPKGTEKKAKDMTYKEAAPKLNEKQKELLNNMAKQNGKSIEEVFETFKDIIGFGEYDPKQDQERKKADKVKQEKLAQERQKTEEKLQKQRQEGEAAARAFQEKLKKGEVAYNEKTEQFEDGSAKTNKPLSRAKATYGSASRLFETKLPPKVSFHSKDRQTEILNNIAKQKSKSGKVSESDLSLPHEEVKEHLNASKYYKQKAKGFTKTDPSYKKYLAKAEEYENKAKAAADDYGLDFSEFIDDSAPLTADTKIKLSQIKTTDDAGFQDGHVSHRKNGDFVKQGGKWVPVKKNGQGNKKQAETQSSTTGKPSPELVKKRLERAEKRKTAKANTTENSKATAKNKPEEPLKWEKGKDNSELAKQNGNSLVITKHYDGSYSWRVGTHPWYPSESGYAKTREEAVKKTTEASKKHPGEIQSQGLTWARSPKSKTNSDRWTAADNGNILTINYNYFDNTYDYTVHEEGRQQDATFKKGTAKTREEAMKEAFKASDEHEHSGIRPIRIPTAQAMGLSYASWNNEDMYASKPRKVAKKK